MMNLLALGLLFSALAAAGVWPIHPDSKSHHHPEPVLREGHRLIVVEYERQVPSDHSPTPPPTDHHLIQEAKEKFQEAASLLPNVGQGLSTPPSSHDAGVKDKLSTLIGKGTDKLSDKESELEEGAKDAVHKTKEKLSELEEGAMDAVVKAKGKLSEKAKDVLEATKEAGEAVTQNVSALAGKAVDRAEEALVDLRRNLTDIIRRARDVAYDAADYVASPETARTAAAVAHLVAVATAYGTCVWVTFVSSHVLARALPRQQFGMVQSRLYPVYFRAVAYSVAVALVGHYYGRDQRVGAERLQGYNLMVVLVLVLFNTFYFEPKATKVMFERMKMDKEEGRGRDMADVVLEATTATAATTTFGGAATTTVAVEQEAVKIRVVKLNKRLKRLNNYSSFINILSLMGLTWHLVHLARCLQVSC